MKKLLIILGSLLTIAILGAWLYLFTYGTPENGGEIFSRFGFGKNTDIPEVIVDREDAAVDVGEGESGNVERLRQLTVRPVAGAGFSDTGIFYVEEGTGHVYHIDLATGEEKLLSGTTIPGARHALFSERIRHC